MFAQVKQEWKCYASDLLEKIAVIFRNATKSCLHEVLRWGLGRFTTVPRIS